MDTRQVFRQGKEIRLSGKEFSLLRYMVQNSGIVLSREKLEQHIWNYDYAGGSNVIDVYIRYLRKKIDDGYEKKTDSYGPGSRICAEGIEEQA